MSKHSETQPDWDSQRMKIIGLGESSIRKSYYPELQDRLHQLEKTNNDLLDAIEEIQSKEEELRQNYEELRIIQSALKQAGRKLNVLNTLTFQDIQNALFSLNGFLSLSLERIDDPTDRDYLEKAFEQMQKIDRSLTIAKKFQSLGINPPKWQKVMEVFLYAVSHISLSHIKREVDLENLEIFADPLLEDALSYIIENIPEHSVHADEYKIWYEQKDADITIIIEDNGVGIEEDMKKKIFEREFNKTRGTGLFLAGEILSVTSITLTETGSYQKGARFELTVPQGCWRIMAPIEDSETHPYLENDLLCCNKNENNL